MTKKTLGITKSQVWELLSKEWDDDPHHYACRIENNVRPVPQEDRLNQLRSILKKRVSSDDIQPEVHDHSKCKPRTCNLNLPSLSSISIYNKKLKSNLDAWSELCPNNRILTVFQMKEPERNKKIKAKELTNMLLDDDKEQEVDEFTGLEDPRKLTLDDQSWILDSTEVIPELRSCLSCKIRQAITGSSCNCVIIKCVCNHMKKHKSQQHVKKGSRSQFHIYHLDVTDETDVLYKRVVNPSFAHVYRQQMYARLLNPASTEQNKPAVNEAILTNLSLFATSSEFLTATSVHELPDAEDFSQLEQPDSFLSFDQINFDKQSEFYHSLKHDGLRVLSNESDEIPISPVPEKEKIHHDDINLGIFVTKTRHYLHGGVPSRDSLFKEWPQIQRNRRRLYYANKINYFTMFTAQDLIPNKPQFVTTTIPGLLMELQCDEMLIRKRFLKFMQHNIPRTKKNKLYNDGVYVYNKYLKKKRVVEVISSTNSSSILSMRETRNPFSGFTDFFFKRSPPKKKKRR